MTEQHLGDLVSALLDGELTAAERSTADAHLGGCPACQAELARTASMRSLVRGLPPVEPPVGFVAGLARQDRRRWPAALVAAAAAIVAVASMASTPRSDDVAPPVGRFVEAHVTATPGGDPVSNLGPASIMGGRVPAPYRAPLTLAGGYQRVGVYRRGAVVQVVYGDGVYGLSVFEQPGGLDWDELPGAGRPAVVDGRRARSYAWPGGRLLAWEAGGSTFTVVGDGPAREVLAAASSLRGAPSLSAGQRLRQTARELVETLSGRG